jgi:hypothetical protein
MWKLRENKQYFHKVLYNTLDPKLTIEVHRDTFEDGIDSAEDSEFYYVFPAYNGQGIPNSPIVHNYYENSSITLAWKDALKDIAKIKKLSIEQIKNFDWRMIE